MNDGELARVERCVVRCRRCPRLVAWREEAARTKVRRFRDQRYWGRPVPGFGDPAARVLVMGLAPGAHGSNRTGRMFTGDGSGDFLYPALFRAGLATQPNAVARGDGMALVDAWITAAARCAPPDNKPTPAELDNCFPWFAREWAALPNLSAVLCLGRVAHDTICRHLVVLGALRRRSELAFSHGAVHRVAGQPTLVDSYHVSRQNTQTGRLTVAMFDAVLDTLRAEAGLRCVPS